MNYFCYQIILREKHFYTNWEWCEVLTGYLHWGAGMAVTGRVCAIGQNVLQPSVPTESSKNTSHFHVSFLKEAYSRNVTITL